MKDLILRYRTRGGTVRLKEYDTVMDFTDVPPGEDGPNDTDEVVDYIFFENPKNSGSGGTIAELKEHCMAILK